MAIKNILAVDDEEMLVGFIKDFLEANDYSVTACTDASQALEIMKSDSDKFDLVITDQNMPVMSGIELIEKIRSFNERVHIILLTGSIGSLEKNNIEDNNIAYYLQKPVKNSQLLECVKHLLC